MHGELYVREERDEPGARVEGPQDESRRSLADASRFPSSFLDNARDNLRAPPRVTIRSGRSVSRLKKVNNDKVIKKMYL